MHGRLSVELYSLLGCCVYSRQLHMHFAFRVFSVPSRLTAELYSLLGFCVFLRHINMHFAFSVLPDSYAICVQGLISSVQADCKAVFIFRVWRFRVPD